MLVSPGRPGGDATHRHAAGAATSNMTPPPIATLLEFCNRLHGTCESILAIRFPMKEEDHLGFMLAVFALVQLDHLRSVVLLVEARLFGQATIIARCMLEGFGYTYWAKDHPSRAKNWRAYSLVHDLKLLRRLQKVGKPVDADREPELLGHLESDAQQFLKKKPRADARAGGIASVVSDPANYHSVWHVDDEGDPVPVGEIIGSGLDEALKNHYFALSAHAHWRADGLGRYISHTSFGSEINTHAEPGDGAGALAMAFQACVQTFALLVVHFSISPDVSLQDLKQEYVEALSKTVSVATPASPPRQPGT